MEYLKEPGLRTLDSHNTYYRLYTNAFINQTCNLKKGELQKTSKL